MEDNDQALSCLEELIKNWPEEEACKPSLVLLGQGNCLPCNEEYEVHEAAIKAGIIEVVDFSSPRGSEIAKRNNIEAVPALLLLDCTDKLIEEKSSPTI
jgi:hypothetical protein